MAKRARTSAGRPSAGARVAASSTITTTVQRSAVPIPATPYVPTDPLSTIIGQNAPQPDPIAWPKPSDPASDPRKVARAASVINREIPNPTIELDWQWQDIRDSLQQHNLGLFDRPAQLCEAILGDDRVQATMGARTSGLLGRPVAHHPSSIARVAGSEAAKECHSAWVEAWPTVANESALGELHRWGIMLGLGPAQLLWDTTSDIAVPHIVPWHPRYTYYQYVWRALIGITMDGLVHITPGDGHWVCHAPNGMHRGWMMGAVRALAKPWIQRNQAYRDLARYCERHGFPMIKIKTPAAADPKQIQALRQQYAGIGQESVVECPQGVDAANSYDVDMLEAKDSTWEVFKSAIDLCDSAITLAVLHQNLTTEVKQGSFAAASVHGDVLQSEFEFDARGLERTIYQQIARPFAAINFGDADLAPMTRYEITPYADNATAAGTFLKFAQAVQQLRMAGIEVQNVDALMKTFDLHANGATFTRVDPTQVESSAVKADADVEVASTSAPDGKGSEDADEE